MDALLARFLPRFTALARTRMSQVLEIATCKNFAAMPEVAHHLHTLAGEAGLLGLTSIVPLARDGEAKAKRLGATHTEADCDELVEVLGRLAAAIELLTPAPQALPESA
jgi:HPt (histidine-containing phosphotransfer) domain-containing protein